MLFRALVVAIGIMGASIAAHAGGTYSDLPPATQPLGSVPDAVPMDQGTGCATNTQPCATVQSPSSRFGQPIQANCQSMSAPTQYEQCINTAVSPPMLEIYLGTTWAPIAIFNASAGTYTPVNDNSVANTVALRASSFAQFPNGVWRLTDGVAGAPKLFYAPDKAGVCSADDGGKCVLGASGGYWLAQFPNEEGDVREWGSSGIQAAVTAMAGTGRLIIDAQTPITLTAAITAPTGSAVDIEGIGGAVSVYATSCPSGVPTIIAAASTTALNFVGTQSATIKGICFQMASTAGTATAGSAIAVGATSGQGNANDVIANNTIINAFDGIMIGGSTTGATQTNGVLLDHNTVISASDKSIGIGETSTNESTAGITLRDNKVACFSAASAAVGYDIADGAYSIYGDDNGPYGCNVGTYLHPGGTSGATQGTLGVMFGVLGDTAISNSLLINPSTSFGVVFYARFVGAWAATVGGTTNSAILVENTNAGTVKTILFSGLTAHSGASQTVPIIDLEAGTDVSVTGSQIAADSNGTTSIGIKLGASLAKAVISGNLFVNSFGHLADDILVASGANNFVIADNVLATGVTVPLSYTPAGQTAVIANNDGLDDACGTVASAGTISFTNDGCDYITGTTAITEISNSAWQNRSHKVISLNGVAFNSGGAAGGAGGGPVCVSTVLVTKQMATADWNPSDQCWTIH